MNGMLNDQQVNVHRVNGPRISGFPPFPNSPWVPASTQIDVLANFTRLIVPQESVFAGGKLTQVLYVPPQKRRLLVPKETTKC